MKELFCNYNISFSFCPRNKRDVPQANALKYQFSNLQFTVFYLAQYSLERWYITQIKPSMGLATLAYR